MFSYSLGRQVAVVVSVVACVLLPGVAFAADTQLSGANTSWILTSTALVLFMTLPGLALF
ncbi:ammonia channel protein, partial [Alphaproteobacteria bacterium]|nr:ammonia channel protein [Alphaproteobacteria bacterium]